MKRTLLLADRSQLSIKCSVWGENCASFDKIDKDRANTIMMKDVKVIDFGGISLNVHEDTMFEINPQTAESEELKLWFKSLKSNDDSAKIQPISLGSDIERLCPSAINGSTDLFVA